MQKFNRLLYVIAALLCATRLATAQTPPPSPASQTLTNAQLRQRLAGELKQITTENVSLEKVLAFLGRELPIQVDWPDLQKAGITPETAVTLSVRNVPMERALLEVLEGVAPNQLTYILDRGTLTIRTKDDTKEGRREAAAALLAEIRSSLAASDDDTAAALLAQVHVIDPALDHELLPKVLASLKLGRDPLALTADGLIRVLSPQAAWLKSHAAMQARLDDPFQDLTIEKQRLAPAVYDFFYTMGIKSYYVNWPQLENLGLTDDSPVTLQLKKQPAGLALTAILEAVGKDKLGFVNNDAVLTISTIDDLENSPRYQRVWVYDVRALIDPAGGEAEPALVRQDRSQKLVAAVKAVADEKSWTRPGRSVEEFAGLLFIRQDDPNHLKIAKRMEELYKKGL